METSDQASSMSPKPSPGTSLTIGMAGGMFLNALNEKDSHEALSMSPKVDTIGRKN